METTVNYERVSYSGGRSIQFARDEGQAKATRSRVHTVGKVVLAGAVLAVGAYYAYPYLPVIAKSLSSSPLLTEVTSLGTQVIHNLSAYSHSFMVSSAAYYAHFTTLFHETLITLKPLPAEALSLLQWSWTESANLVGWKSGCLGVGLISFLTLLTVRKNKVKPEDIYKEFEIGTFTQVQSSTKNTIIKLSTRIKSATLGIPEKRVSTGCLTVEVNLLLKSCQSAISALKDGDLDEDTQHTLIDLLMTVNPSLQKILTAGGVKKEERSNVTKRFKLLNQTITEAFVSLPGIELTLHPVGL